MEVPRRELFSAWIKLRRYTDRPLMKKIREGEVEASPFLGWSDGWDGLGWLCAVFHIPGQQHTALPELFPESTIESEHPSIQPLPKSFPFHVFRYKKHHANNIFCRPTCKVGSDLSAVGWLISVKIWVACMCGLCDEMCGTGDLREPCCERSMISRT